MGENCEYKVSTLDWGGEKFGLVFAIANKVVNKKNRRKRSYNLGCGQLIFLRIALKFKFICGLRNGGATHQTLHQTHVRFSKLPRTLFNCVQFIPIQSYYVQLDCIQLNSVNCIGNLFLSFRYF